MKRGGSVALSVGIAAVLAVVAGCGKKAEKAAAPAAPAPAAGSPVQVIPAATGVVLRRVPVTGSLKALESVELSPKQGGRLVAVSVREGDPVARGQVVARIDTSDLEARARSAEAAVSAARARLAQAEAAYQQQVVGTRTGIESAEAAVRSAQAGLKAAQAGTTSARAQLSQVRSGARRQEIAQQEAQVAIARRQLAKAESDFTRYQTLRREGAVAESVLDQYRTTRDVAAEQLRAAQQALSLVQEGARAEEVERAQQGVQQAEAAQRQAEAGVRQAEEQLRQARAASAQNRVRQAEVKAAQAAIQQEQNALTIARQAIQDAVVRAPIAGQVAERYADTGEVVGSGTRILRVVALSTVFFEPTVPDVEVGRIRAGQPVAVTVDAFPGRSFSGTVSRIYPSGSEASRAFPIRVTLPNPGQALRPEMFARGMVVTERRTNTVLVPREAVVRSGSLAEGNQTVRVFTVENGVAQAHDVTLGLSSEDGKSIEARGVPAGAQVVVSGQRGIRSGDRVSQMTGRVAEQSASAR